jgi:uncharacterized metal-binding protein
MAHGDKDRLELLREKFYEGTSTLAEEKELAQLAAGGGDPAEAAMFALFGREKETRCPGVAVPLRRRRNRGRMLFAATAATAAVAAIVSVTVRMPERQAVFCVVNGIPVTDPVAVMEKKEMAVDVLFAVLDNTASMMPLEEVERAMDELESLGMFDITGI